jgi:hypothetical protein
MPFIMGFHGFRIYTNPEQAKLQLAQVWRRNQHVRSIGVVDELTRQMYERLYQIQQADVIQT